MTKVWLVTGASSGFGKEVTKFALSKGDIVVATLRKPEVLKDLEAIYPKDKLLVLKVDVTQQTEIEHAFAQTKEVFGRLDVVFNNAGFVINGEAEATQLEDARRMFEVNFWGAVNVSLAAVKFFRDVNGPEKGGLLLQNSSASGLVGGPSVSFYSASKHAFEGFSEGLAGELLPGWNIKVCMIEPGGFMTNVMSNAIHYETHPKYNDPLTAPVLLIRKAGTVDQILSGDPEKFAKAVYSVVESGNIPPRLPLGQDTLFATKMKVDRLTQAIAQGERWSGDLRRDGIGSSGLASG